MSDPITVSVSIDAAQLAAALKPAAPDMLCGLTATELYELMEQHGRWFEALQEIRRMTGCGADQIAARALGRNT